MDGEVGWWMVVKELIDCLNTFFSNKMNVRGFNGKSNLLTKKEASPNIIFWM